MNKKYIKFDLENRPWDWWLRSADSYCSNLAGYVDYDGDVYGNYAYDYDGVLFICFEI